MLFRSVLGLRQLDVTCCPAVSAELTKLLLELCDTAASAEVSTKDCNIRVGKQHDV